MKKSVIIVMALLAFGVSVQAQNREKLASKRVQTETKIKTSPQKPMNSKFGKELQQYLAKGKGRKMRKAAAADGVQAESFVNVMVMLLPSAGVTAEVLESVGCTVNWSLKSQAFVTVPVDKLDALAELDGVLGINLPQTAKLHNDVAREVTHVSTIADPVSALAAGLPKEYDGSGVIVGVVDAGIDFSHPAFRNADGTTRIKRAFTYRRRDEIKPDEPESNWKNTYTDPDEILNVVPLTNYTHGSHTTAIAAGSNTGNNLQGMAPGADLVLSDLIDLPDNYLISGLKSICEYAEEVGKPVVTNFSIGSDGTFRDGCDYMSQAIEELSGNGTKPGVIFSLSSGNSGDIPNYIHHTFISDDEKFYVMMDVPVDTLQEINTDTPGETVKVHPLVEQYIVLSAFINRDVDNAEEMLVAYSLDEKRLLDANEPIGLANIYRMEEDGEEYYGLFKAEGSEFIGREVITLGNLRALLFNDWCYGYSTHNCRDGVTKKRELFYKITEDMTIFLFEDVRLGGCFSLPAGTEMSLENNVGEFIIPDGFDYLHKGTPEGSLNDIACNMGNITVGSYNVHNRFTNFFGDDIDLSYTCPLGEVSDFTSYGYTNDGNDMARPDGLAPGSFILSAVNSNYAPYFESYGNPLPKEKIESPVCLTQKIEYEGKNYWYEYMQGTSMAAPVVTGIIALWLQADPTLSVRDVREVIAKTSQPVAADIPLQAGHGLIDALAGLKYILSERVGIDNVSFEQPADKRIFTLDGREVKSSPSRGIYVTNGRKILAR